MLHGLVRRVHGGEDARVGRQDEAARKDVAEEEERHSVGARRRQPIGQAPVDAAGGAVGLRSVLAPVAQRAASEQQRVEPSAGHQQTAMNAAESVSCERK